MVDMLARINGSWKAFSRAVFVQEASMGFGAMSTTTTMVRWVPSSTLLLNFATLPTSPIHIGSPYTLPLSSQLLPMHP